MSDTVVLVTGGGGHLGIAVSRLFLERGSDVSVPVYHSDRSGSTEALGLEHPDRVHTFALDLTTERGASEAVREVVRWRGRLDGVVHLVGGYEGGSRLAETPLEVWERMMDLNLKSAWLVARAAIPVMLGNGGGSLVFVSSRAARRGRAGHGAYSIAKAGVLTLVETLAAEYGDEGVRANAVLPGLMDTEANREQMPAGEHDRWTSPAEVAEVIHFLTLGPSRAVNGASVPVYGRS
jgi:NAD(P)-dependent dehydrogenase (short-subunit alcohol dehydrogenase family)